MPRSARGKGESKAASSGKGDQEDADSNHLASRTGQSVHGESVHYDEGPYRSETKTVGRFDNMAETALMLNSFRLTPGTVGTVDWQLGLRGGSNRKPQRGWSRLRARTQRVSLDCSEELSRVHDGSMMRSEITQGDGDADNSTCKVNGGQWQHLYTDRKVTNGYLNYVPSLRAWDWDNSGAGIDEKRSDACLVEMMGKKRWHFSRRSDSIMSGPPPRGDARLHHLGYMNIMAEEDARSHRLRTSRHSARAPEPPEMLRQRRAGREPGSQPAPSTAPASARERRAKVAPA